MGDGVDNDVGQMIVGKSVENFAAVPFTADNAGGFEHA